MALAIWTPQQRQQHTTPPQGVRDQWNSRGRSVTARSLPHARSMRCTDGLMHVSKLAQLAPLTRLTTGWKKHGLIAFDEVPGKKQRVRSRGPR